MRTNNGADLQAVQMGGGLSGEIGIATATTATSITTNSAVTHASNDLAGQRVVALTSGVVVEGTILSNTAGTATVITIDRWVQPGNSVTATTPSSTTAYAILGGGSPARHIALSTNATAPAATDTTLTGELVASGGGLVRAKATYSHTIGTAAYTLTNTWTANSTDTGGGSVQINKMGVFNSAVSSVGIMLFEAAVPSPPTLVAGDTISITDTINY
jgi:hypothetical protein